MLKIFKSSLDSTLNEDNSFEKDSWIDLVNPTKEEIQKVSEACKINTSIILQVLVEKELPRVKKFDGGVLIVIDVPYMKDKSIRNKYVTYPLGIILCDSDYILTVSLVEHIFLNKFKQNKVENFDVSKRSRFLMQIFFNSSSAYLYTLDVLDMDIKRVEKSSYHSTNNKQMLNFLNIQKSLVYFITSLRANSTVLEKLQKENVIPMSKDEKILLEDAVIENKQCIETARLFLII